MDQQSLQQLQQQLLDELSAVQSPEELEAFRLRHLVKKGTIPQLFTQLRSVPKEEKPIFGRLVNELRQVVEQRFQELKQQFEQKAAVQPTVDLTLPGRQPLAGIHHPVYATMAEMLQIFQEMGFTVVVGPEIEDDYHNFEALNFPPDHPARDMQDTFFIEPERENPILLRTHTSPVQIRVMENLRPPIRTVMPGRVYRNEAISVRSLAEFHQIEGLYVDRSVTFAEMKGMLVAFVQRFYGAETQYTFRPSFFPFTEPSAEMDITCFLCKGKGCRVCKFTGWLEILGCGMVHPNVLRACDIDPEEFSGFAFGMGVERITMLRTGITDIRMLYDNDLRVLEQFA